MKRNKTIIGLSAIAVASTALAFSFMSKNNVELMANAETVQTVGQQLIAQEGFASIGGAAVRMKTASAGIKFGTSVTKSFVDYLETTYEGATFEWHTLITGVNMLEGGDVTKVTPDLKKPESVGENAGKPACQDFELSLKTVSETTFEYAAAIVYEGEDFSTLTDAQKQATYKADLIARSYVKVSQEGEEDVIIYAQADDTVRNMKGVAFAAIEEGTYATDTTKEGLLYPYLGFTKENAETMITTTGTHGGYCSEVDGLYEVTVEEGAMKTGVTYDAYIGAKKVTYTKNGNVLTLGNMNGTKKGNVNLSLFGNDGTIINQPFTNATLAIDDASDLDYFNMMSEAKTLDGYYVLTKNIEYNNAHFEQARPGHSKTINDLDKEEYGGLTGTFDGNGYTINEFKVSGAGLFKALRGGTIKNVAFTNVNIYAYANINSLFAEAITSDGGTMENVYVSVVSRTSNASYACSLFYYGFGKNFKANNVVVEYASTVTSSACANKGSFIAWGFDGTQPTQMQNVYVVGPDALNKTYDAPNREAATVWAGVKRYDTVADWKANTAYGEVAKTENDYMTFSETYWTKADGIVTWKAKLNPGEKVDVEYENILTNFSALDGDTVMAEYNLADAIGGETVVSVTDKDGNALSYENGKVLGLKTNGQSATETYIIVETNEKKIKINLVAYTLVIDNASDLDYFKMSSEDKDATLGYYTKEFDGYYILAKNIDYNNAKFEQVGDTKDYFAVNKSVGLTGTFDGNGYTISNLLMYGHGLFYNIYGGTIKNVAFINVEIKSWNTRNALFGLNFTKGSLDNVYIKTVNGGSNRYTLAHYMEFKYVTMNNVVIESEGATGFEPLCLAAEYITTAGAFNNVYIINSTVVRGGNDATNRGGALSGVKRYDTVADWKANTAYGEVAKTENDYTTFSETYWTKADNIVTWKQKADPVA